MSVEPDVAAVAGLIGEPTRAVMLGALLGGVALPAGELAARAHITPQTASRHLARLIEGAVLEVRAVGRRRYYRIANPRVGAALEALAVVAQPPRSRTLRESEQVKAMRFARTCYDHLAGMLGTKLMESLLEHELLTGGDGVFDPEAAEADRLSAPGYDLDYRLTAAGIRELKAFGIDFDSLPARRPLIRYCVDWSEQRHHLAGSLGAAITTRMLDLGWVRRAGRSRALHVSDDGFKGLREQFGVELSPR